MEIRLRTNSFPTMTRGNKLNDLMAKKYQPKGKSIEEQIAEDVTKIAEKVGVDYSMYLSASYHLCEELAWRYFKKLSAEYSRMAKNGELAEDESMLFKKLMQTMNQKEEQFHRWRQQVMRADGDNFIDAMASKMQDGFSMDFFQLEMSARNEVCRQMPDGSLTDVRKYALMMVVMIDLAYDMFDYCEERFREANPSYHFVKAGEILRGDRLICKMREFAEIMCSGMDLGKALSGNLMTSRKVFTNKIINEIKYNIEHEGK